MGRGRLLWIGDAGCQSGFAKCTHETLKALVKRWDVSVLGVNYRGFPHDYPYPMYPAIFGGDAMGFKMLTDLRRDLMPDVVVIQNDPWNFPVYLKKLDGIPLVGAVAVDGLNCRGSDLNGLKLAIFWTDFGAREARAGGYAGPSAVVPLGVNLDTFHPLSRAEARHIIGIPKHVRNAFIVGNVNRNQPRKRLDLTIRYFARWVKRYSVEDAFLFLHVAPTGDVGYDCVQLASYYGISNRLIIVNTDVFRGISEERLNLTYNCFDLQFTTTQGEGWGLPALEGMAAGVPLLAPDWSALGEWAKPAAHLVECTSTSATPGEVNAIGGIMDEEKTILALQELYVSAAHRARLSDLGLALAQEERFRWENIGEKFADAMDEQLNYGPVQVKEQRAKRREVEV